MSMIVLVSTYWVIFHQSAKLKEMVKVESRENATQN